MGTRTRIVHNRSGVSILNEGEAPKPAANRLKQMLASAPVLANKRKTMPPLQTFDLQVEKQNRGQRLMRYINYLFMLILLGIFGINAFFIYQYDVNGYTPTQAFRGVARNSLQVVDTVWEPELKSTNGYTGALVMGIDSRKLEFDGQEFKGKDRDIDSIIQVVIKHSTGEVFFLSLPRDIGVTVTETCARQAAFYFKSINHVYKLAEDGNCPGGGIELMQKYVTSVTGFENHYYAIISYDAFRDIINTVGDPDPKGGAAKGLYLDVPRNVQEYYPREQGGGFEAVYFPKGRQFIDSVKLLKYARSRKASSDFDRAKRQQQVLEALQAKVLSEETMTDPVKVYNLYRSFQKNALFSPLNLDDIRGGISLAQKIDEERTYKLVLDDNFGGLNSLITRPTFSGKGTHNRPGYYLSPVAYNHPDCLAKQDEYCKLKSYLQAIYKDPSLVSEEATIFAYANTRGSIVSNPEFVAGQARFASSITLSKYALPALQAGGPVQIYDFSDGTKPKARAALAKAFKVQVQDGATAPFTKPLNNEDFTIIVKTN